MMMMAATTTYRGKGLRSAGQLLNLDGRIVVAQHNLVSWTRSHFLTSGRSGTVILCRPTSFPGLRLPAAQQASHPHPLRKKKKLHPNGLVTFPQSISASVLKDGCHKVLTHPSTPCIPTRVSVLLPGGTSFPPRFNRW